jgi:hypothetical protein
MGCVKNQEIWDSHLVGAASLARSLRVRPRRVSVAGGLGRAEGSGSEASLLVRPGVGQTTFSPLLASERPVHAPHRRRTKEDAKVATAKAAKKQKKAA